MDSALITSNLRAVGEKLRARGLTGEIVIFGGAYMLLVIKSREATKDVDAYLAGDASALREAAAEVAAERGLAADWLNDAVKGFFTSEAKGLTLFASYPGLNVYAPEAEYIFAMKVSALRPGTADLDDLRALRAYLKLESIEQALDIVERYIPKRLQTPRMQLSLEVLFSEENDDEAEETR